MGAEVIILANPYTYNFLELNPQCNVDNEDNDDHEDNGDNGDNDDHEKSDVLIES